MEMRTDHEVKRPPYPGLAVSSEDQHHFDPFSTERRPCVLTIVQILLQ